LAMRIHIATKKIYSQTLNRIIIKTSFAAETSISEIKQYCEKLSIVSKDFYFVNAGVIGVFGAYLEFSYFGGNTSEFELALRTILESLEEHPKLKVEQVVIGREITL